jgi:hypothetical protein
MSFRNTCSEIVRHNGTGFDLLAWNGKKDEWCQF